MAKRSLMGIRKKPLVLALIAALLCLLGYMGLSQKEQLGTLYVNIGHRLDFWKNYPQNIPNSFFTINVRIINSNVAYAYEDSSHISLETYPTGERLVSFEAWDDGILLNHNILLRGFGTEYRAIFYAFQDGPYHSGYSPKIISTIDRLNTLKYLVFFEPHSFEQRKLSAILFRTASDFKNLKDPKQIEFQQ